MIFGKTRLELKIGIFVFGALMILGVFLLMIGDVKTMASGRKISFIVNFSNGIKIGSPIRFSGVDIGDVKEIVFTSMPGQDAPKVKITGWIKKDVNIPADSTVWINTLGILGEKYIEIMPGKDYSRYVLSDEAMMGNDPVAMHEIVELAKKAIIDIDDSIVRIKNKEGTIGKLLFDDELYKSLEAALKNKEGTFGRFLYDDTIFRNVDDLVKDIKAHPWKLLFKPKDKPVKK